MMGKDAAEEEGGYSHSDTLSLCEKRSGTRARKYRAQGPTFFKGPKRHPRHPARWTNAMTMNRNFKIHSYSTKKMLACLQKYKFF